jgi:hypothetical protein
MSRTLNTDLFYQVCQIIEQEGEDQKLLEKLKKYSVILSEHFENIITLQFFTGFQCSISFNGEWYNLLLDSEDDYHLGERCNTKMSPDRIYFYLNQFINTALYGR